MNTPDEHLAPIELDLLREPEVVQAAALTLSQQLQVDCTAAYAGLRRSAERARMPLPDVALVVVRRRWDRATGDSGPG
ncbi:hypothetical protein EV383_3829 [Pseudonocardia sediminis]|uniref:ANTAR domain-containing protein n=1 Tax=Pseudonocardia sediminis TaxID=1397368 RepID=A0A4Q7V2W8_PSEST|nr:hypothetical protein [Pseudonocardia sediminis]RZT86929.1 hypothetical protein EV383_3829 [Pseudonocardia sediminis]